MKILGRTGILLGLWLCVWVRWPALAETPAVRVDTGTPRASMRDGQHDFDFNLGTWKTHISRLQHPLSGSKAWVDLEGTVVVKKVWGGRAQLEEIEADGASGHFESLTLFLYNPGSQQWSISFASSSDGALSQPAIGEFKNGRGEFYDQESFNGRAILVRVVWSDITPNSHHFEQSFSEDGGRTWEPNFAATLTREIQPTLAIPPADLLPGQRDFDWQTGRWKVHMSRLQHPLTGSTTWTELDGTVMVRRVWGGRAQLAEITADGPSGQLEFLSLRLFNPQSHQWSLNFASSNSGTLSTPMVGEFRNGRGEFYDQESFNGRMIWVRFVFANLTGRSNRDEQAFSNDGGRTWETNWINESTRTNDEK